VSIRTILLVDDDPIFLEAWCALLHLHGFGVFVARDGVEGLNAAQAHRPELVVTDWNMPSMNGADLCRELRKHAELRAVPVILWSGASAPTEGTVCWDRFLRKPAHFDRVIETINELLSAKTRLGT
jgi:DNA-binding response OmpR family regulator